MEGLGDVGLIALVAIVPLVVLMLTSFVKVSVVLSLLRNAIGATDAPSGLVVMGLSLVLTFFVMAPVAVEMVTAAAAVPVPGPGGAPGGPAGRQGAGADPLPTGAGVVPAPTWAAPPGTALVGKAPTGLDAGAGPTGAAPTGTAPTGAGADRAPPDRPPTGAASTSVASVPLELEAALRALVPAKHHAGVDALARALGPLRRFLGRHADERDRATFVALAGSLGHAAAPDELRVLAPAFLTTELREAFAIAVLIFIPFLVIDLIVGLGLAALGLTQTSPQVVALPLKLLLFVAVDGWRLLIDSLLRGYV